MKKKLIIFSFIFSVLIGMSPDLLPYYIASFNSQTLHVLPSADVLEKNCVNETETSKCFIKYNLKIGNTYKSLKNPELGAGQIIYATRFFCNSELKPFATFDDYIKPGRLFDVFNLYQVVELPLENCENVTIESWGPKAAVRKGQIGGRFVVGDSMSVQQVKRWSEFFCREIYQAFVFCFALLLIISFRLKESLKEIKPDEIEETISLWLVCAIASVGLIQLILPITSLPQFTNKIGAIFILSAFFTSFFVRPSITKFNRILMLTVALFFSALMLTDYFQKIFVYSLFLIALMGLVQSLRRKSFLLLVLAAAQLLSALKIYGFRFLPNAMMVYFFVGTIALIKLSIRLRVTSSYAKFISFISSLDKTSSNQVEQITLLLNSTIEISKSNSISLLKTLENSKIQIRQFGFNNEELALNSIPPIFAHSMSLRKEVWHLRVGSPEFYRIKKTGDANSDKGKYISVLPIYDEERMYGAIAVTGYSEDIVNTAEYDIEMKAILRLTADTLRTLLKREESNQKSLWQELSVSTSTAITEIKATRASATLPLQSVAETISSAIHGSAFIAELDHATRKFIMKGIHGFNPFVHERFTLGTLYAHVDNEQGPIALAVNKKQPVIVPDVKYLKEVLHENSVQFFEKNNTLSCAGIPIFKTGSDTVWGILWLERPNGEEAFNYLAESPLQSLASVVAQYVDRIEKTESLHSTTSALQEFLPPEVYAEVIKNGNYRQDDHGYMMMLDLKGSTKVSLAKGSDYWLERAVKIKEPLKEIGLKYGLKLREYKWDAFIFTKSEKVVSRKAVFDIIEFCREATTLIEDWYNESFTDLSAEVKETQQKGRFCITF